MKSILTLFICLCLFAVNTLAYLAERSSPYTVTISNYQQAPIQVRKGDKIELQWNFAPGVRFPLYGYACPRTAKTDVGLLAMNENNSRTQPYVYTISTGLSLLDNTFSWTVGDDVPSGEYRIGIGFFYHEATQSFVVL
ncbi:hypothetical protein EDC96DRAFT_502563 [Choanephora cucurbitarum]|nr:hypothetical protein EDC96DRAFT_502563 [Choanephora cucurbitarum]